MDQCDGVCEGLSWVDCMGGVRLSLSLAFLFLSSLDVAVVVVVHADTACSSGPAGNDFALRIPDADAVDAPRAPDARPTAWPKSVQTRVVRYAYQGTGGIGWGW